MPADGTGAGVGVGAGSGESDGCVDAVLECHIIAACGLQAAVLEACAWLGGAGTSLLGSAAQLGPHPFVQLQLFPTHSQLAQRIPPLRTPFQVGYSICMCAPYFTMQSLNGAGRWCERPLYVPDWKDQSGSVQVLHV